MSDTKEPTVHEAHVAKAQLEEQIANLLREFTASTGMKIGNIYLHMELEFARGDYVRDCARHGALIYTVEVEAKL